MAKALSSEEIQFRKRARRRLIGAIALVLIAVVVLPMVLEQEPRPVSHPIEIRIPSQETAPPLEVPTPLKETAPVDRPQALSPSPATSHEAAGPAAQKERQDALQAGAAPVPPEPAPASRSAAPPPKGEMKAAADSRVGEATGGYVVQVGAFSSAENAKQLKDRLSANGIQAYTETVATTKGRQVRVRAGPFPTREAAEQTLAKLERLGLNGIIASP
ncbi:SPOR domain-containing protein [Pelomicrobium sp.]|uniref:SPOR domain-containing protein n=1 Tax=Pelomicrobium sp. TaxID=2815319 RepID=UPI002FDEE30D